MQSITNPSPDFRWARVTGPHLKVLDRYMNIQPWHNNRIKLHVPEGHVDYVNASPIALAPSSACASLEPDRYIAMQGPKQVSTDHVWRMVAEQLDSPGVIVMLTETHEGHMEKCYPYFPRSKDDPPLEINERDEFGDGFRATVRCEGLEETPAGDAIELRKLVIRVYSTPKPNRPSTPDQPTAAAAVDEDDEKDSDSDTKMKSPLPANPGPLLLPSLNPLSPLIMASSPPSPTTSPTITPTPLPLPAAAVGDYEDRVVYHFLYKKWPDFGVPSLADLDSFFTLMRLSRAKNASPSNPRIVHCSAGVGRSGTFIALEHLMRELEAGVLEGYDERAAAAGMLFGDVAGGSGGGEAGEGEGEEKGLESGSGTPISLGSFDMGRGGEDLVFETVDRLREQRRTMVQAESQYLFVYQVLRKLWVEKYGCGKGVEDGGDDDGDDDDGTTGEPAAKRLEFDPFVE
jgi:protein tyrosine phosphatase